MLRCLEPPYPCCVAWYVQAEAIEDVEGDAREPRHFISKPFVMARTQVDHRW